MRQGLAANALAAASEVAVVLLAMNGDDAAYGELVRRRQGSIRNLLRRLTRDAALADDLAQQTFVQGWLSIRGLKAPGAFAGWLRKLAVNFWLQNVRSSRPEVAIEEDLRTEFTASGAAQRLDLDAALARLPGDVRLCIVLAYSEGLSHGEISQTAAIPLGTVKSHIARGSARLRELLQGYGDMHV
ncbi:MAG TPA: sigma-70 family RNA polymerase sigma factor [Steroidobacteraceae bacterium]|nr:sigma-70 family RNA polymerase sigma factor [Steroidobacteraceae bacterium]